MVGIVPSQQTALLLAARIREDFEDEIVLSAADLVLGGVIEESVLFDDPEEVFREIRIALDRPQTYEVSRYELKNCVSGLSPVTASHLQSLNCRPFRSKRG